MGMRRTFMLLSALALLLTSCGSGTDEGQDAQPTGSSEVSADGSTGEPTPSGSAVSVPVGTWTGTATGRDIGTFSVRVTIPPCRLHERCGEFDEANSDHQGAASSCGGILLYMRTQDDAFVLQEEVTYNRGNFTCMGMPMYLSPIDERTLLFKEDAGPDYATSEGTLHLADETP
jgi:hypothetical protein